MVTEKMIEADNRKVWNSCPRLEDGKTSWLKALRYASGITAGQRESIERILTEREMQEDGGSNGKR